MTKKAFGCIWDNCHCPAFRLLFDVDARVCCALAYPHARVRMNRTSANERRRELATAARCQTDARQRGVQMALIRVHGECCYGAHRLPLAERWLINESADVLPVRQRICSKIDNYNCPRQMPPFENLFKLYAVSIAGQHNSLSITNILSIRTSIHSIP